MNAMPEVSSIRGSTGAAKWVQEALTFELLKLLGRHLYASSSSTARVLLRGP